MSLTSLLLLGGLVTPAWAGGVPTSGFLAAKMAMRQAGTASGAVQSVGPGVAGGTQAALPVPAMARVLAARSMASLDRAAAAIVNATQAQQTAQAAAAFRSAPPDGLVAGGLQLAAGVPKNLTNPQSGDDPTLWQNAELPTQIASGGQTTIGIKQTQQRAILTWNSFNVGKHTTVNFDQSTGTDSSGSNSWVALNRIVDKSGNPAQIFGSINALGSVYVIDANGVMFGGGSQVNVHNLIASSVDIGTSLGESVANRNSAFLANGLNLSPANVTDQAIAAAFTSYDATLAPTTAEGPVTIAAGASLNASSFSPDNPGALIMLAPNVFNAGSLSAPAGQVILSSGRAFGFIPITGATAAIANNPVAPYIGLDVQNVNVVQAPTNAPIGPGATSFYPGIASNSGIIQTPRGNISLVADQVENDGVLAATTSITRNGSIVLRGGGAVTLGSNSSLSILPDMNGETIPGSGISAFAPPQIQISANAAVTPAGSNSPTPPSSGGDVTMLTGSTIVSPGAVTNIYAAQDVYVDSGALIDVSGLTNTMLQMSANFLTFQPRGQEFANSPLQRNGPLRGQNLTIDIRQTGIFSDGTSWVGTPLANASGYVANLTHGIGELLSVGGDINIVSGGTAASSTASETGQIILRQGSTLNVSGGYITYQGGTVSTTRLRGSDGHIYDLAQANPLLSYQGLFGEYTVDHAHWGVSNSYGNPNQGQHDEPGYVEGRDAGGIVLAATSIVADGALYGQAVAGPRQRTAAIIGTATPTAPPTITNFHTDPLDARALQASGNQLPVAGFLAVTPPTSNSIDPFFFNVTGSTSVPTSDLVLIQASPGDLPSNFGPTTLLSAQPTPLGGLPASLINALDPANTTVLISGVINAGGFDQLSVNTQSALRQNAGTNVTVAPGGTISLAAGGVEINGTLTASGGSISIKTSGLTQTLAAKPNDASNVSGDLTVGPGAVLDASGLWVNDNGRTDGSAQGSAFINGGSITLAASSYVVSANTPQNAGNVRVDPTALLDLSSGGYVQPNGILKQTGVVGAGAGGNLSLLADNGGQLDPLKLPSAPSTGSVFIDFSSSVRAFGFSTGGTLSLQTADPIIIADALSGQGINPATDADGTLRIPSQFFYTNNPFGAFNLQSDYGGIIVAPFSRVILRQSNFQPTTLAASLPSGNSIYSVSPSGQPYNPIALLPAFQRAPVNLTLGSSFGNSGFFSQSLPTTAGTTSVGMGAFIDGEAGASLSVNGATGVSILGTIGAASGKITIATTSTLAASSIYLGSSSRIDVAGTSITDTTNINYLSGSVLAGGSVTLLTSTEAGSTPANSPSSYIAEAPGAIIDVRGASGSFQYPIKTAPAAAGPLPGGNNPLGDATAEGPSYGTETIYSDAGTVTIKSSSLLGGATIKGSGGGPTAANATLMINPVNTASVNIQQAALSLPSNFLIGSPLPSSDLNTLFLSASMLNATQFDDIVIGASGASLNDVAYTNGQPSLINFLGSVNLEARRNLILNGAINVLAGSNSSPNGITHVTASVSAAYILLGGGATSSSPAPVATSSFSAYGQAIDLTQSSINATNTLIQSSGDVRVVTPFLSTSLDKLGSNPTFGLAVTGDLTIAGHQLYPTGGAPGLISSTAAGGTITIGSTGPSSVPFSAGGSLTIEAANIVQGGTVRAPSGTLTFNAKDPVTQALGSLTFAPGSVTSVSLGGLSLPYGGTVDGKAWYYDDNDRSQTPLAAPPAKLITTNAADITFAKGATIDVSGGGDVGDVYASEFVPGTGGSRDILAAANAPAGSQIYAILPGSNPTIAPHDLDFQTFQGFQDVSPLAGETVTLSASSGLAAGTYTLLPAHYATLPGAYRVVVTAGGNLFQNSQNQILPDGTMLVSGQLGNIWTGERQSQPIQVQVQSNAVWRSYTEIDQAGANSFFAAYAVKQGSLIPQLPQDAGQLQLQASKALTLDGILATAVGSGGRGGQVDIAASDIQITAPGAMALAGYVQLDSVSLSELGADSLLIGGTRSLSNTTETINAVSTSVVVSNDAQHALTGPEILLVTAADPTGTDPNSSAGLRINQGAVIAAQGAAPSSGISTVSIGAVPIKNTSGVLTGGVSGDGALLRVSNAGQIALLRNNLPTPSTATLTVEAGAQLIGGAALLLDASGSVVLNAAASISGTNITASSSSISLGNVGGVTSGLALSSSEITQINQATTTLTLRTPGTISFLGPVSLALQGPGSSLTLDAATLLGQSDPVTLGGGSVSFANSGMGTGLTGGGTGRLTIQAGEIVLDNGTQSIAGFSDASLLASHEILASGLGSLNLGAAALTLNTPQILAGPGSNEAISTTGTAALVSTGSPTGANGQIGGTFGMSASAIQDGSTILAPSGKVTLDATSGDLTLSSAAKIDVGGYGKAAFDVATYSAGGTVTLTAEQGSATLSPGSVVNVSGSALGGDAGSVSISAKNGSVDISASLSGSAPLGTGGSFSLVTGGAIALDNLAASLTSGGFNGQISAIAGSGDLSLTQSLKAQSVVLRADHGAVAVSGIIDASGDKGGEIDLYGATGVALNGSLLARGSNPSRAGGIVTLGTSGTWDGSSLDPSYGFEAIALANAGTITLGANALIDASGGTTEGLTGGTVTFLAPLVSTGATNLVPVTIDPAARIMGAHRAKIDAYAVWSTTDPQQASATNSHFDGIIDPAGWYDSSGNLVAGTATDPSGNIIQAPTQLPAGDIFTPDPAATLNQQHIDFYQTTLMQFVRDFGVSSGHGGLHVDPEVELSNPSSSVNAGGITLASNWNLGAASFDGTTALPLYRTASGDAGVLTLRAAGNIAINASLTDGFFQTGNRLDPAYLTAYQTFAFGNPSDPTNTPPLAPYDPAANSVSNNATTSDANPVLSADLFAGNPSWSYNIVAGADFTGADPLALRSLSQATGSGSGDVTLSGHTTYRDPTTTLLVAEPTVVRTGTGSITIAAARDFSLLDPLAPGAVYTAGRPSAALPSPGYVAVDGGAASGGTTSVANVDGFQAPDLNYFVPGQKGIPFTLTTPAYPEAGGSVTITAQRDINAIQAIYDDANGDYTGGPGGFLGQFYTNWLLHASAAAPDLSGAKTFDGSSGFYNPNAVYASTNPAAGYAGSGAATTGMQTTWWINFGGFDQGVAALGGGDVSILAGRNIRDLAASTPSTGRVSGGLSGTSKPILQMTGGGDLSVVAGGDILSGSYYVGLGKGKILAGGSILSDWNYITPATTTPPAPVATVLAVGDAQIRVGSRGSIDLGDVTNPTYIDRKDFLALGSVFASYISEHGGTFADIFGANNVFNTITPDSTLALSAGSGDIQLLSNQSAFNSSLYTIGQSLTSGGRVTVLGQEPVLPSMVTVTALNGNIVVDQGFTTTNSKTSSLNLIAANSLLLSGRGAPTASGLVSTDGSSGVLASYQITSDQFTNPLPGVIDTQFDPSNPANSYNSLSSQNILLHTADTSINHLYAQTGDIANGLVATYAGGLVPNALGPMDLQFSTPTALRAGRDIMNVSLFGQNLRPQDATTIAAGRDILDNLPFTASNPTPFNMMINLAGPGTLDVEAGRTLGTFVSSFTASGGSSASGLIATGNNVWSSGFNNPLLPRESAAIVALAGVAPGIDYQAIVTAYLDPAGATAADQIYLPQLSTYLAQNGLPGLSGASAFAAFQSLDATQQHLFIDQIFFAELAATQANPGNPVYQRGYRAINTMFPAAFGYTQNNLTGGANGANATIATGDIDLRNATIQTQQPSAGISVFSPGGTVFLGSTVARPIYSQPGATGILTFQGGNVNLFADLSIIVNQSRVLTEEGGNLLIWSSNADINAGRGAKTAAAYPPYSVYYDQNGNQLLNPAGLVTGAGIGALLTIPGQNPLSSNAIFVAPRGTIDAGDAGIRIAGNLTVAALHVLNADNIQVGGKSVGLPIIPAINTSALAAASAAAASSTRVIQNDNSQPGANARYIPAIVTVDIVGFGQPSASQILGLTSE